MRVVVILYKPLELAVEIKSEDVVYVLPNRESLGCWQNEPARVPEIHLIRWALSWFPEGKVLLDIGANVGVWSLNFAKSPTVKHVHAFEPQMAMNRALRAAVHLNQLQSKISVYDVAVGSGSVSSASLRIIDEAGGSSSICSLPTNSKCIRTEVVPVISLDKSDFVSKVRDIGLIKLDVEGHELEVFQGSVETLEANEWPTVIFEAWVVDWYREDKMKLFSFLEFIGYKVISVSGYNEQFIAERNR
jgi:FkbM family methyltransferase